MDDVILYLHDVADEAPRAAQAELTADAMTIAARIASYVEIKPRVFGVSSVLKAVLQDVAARRWQ